MGGDTKAGPEDLNLQESSQGHPFDFRQGLSQVQDLD